MNITQQLALIGALAALVMSQPGGPDQDPVVNSNGIIDGSGSGSGEADKIDGGSIGLSFDSKKGSTKKGKNAKTGKSKSAKTSKSKASQYSSVQSNY